MKETYADLRRKDPVIRDILRHMISRNVYKPEIDAIEKILCEGADGRYLAEVEIDKLPMSAQPQ